MIAPDDRGLTLGDGLFETLLAVDGQLRDVEAHLDRMVAGCATLGLPPPERGVALKAMTDALDAQDGRGGRWAVRLTLTAGWGGRGLDRPAQPGTRLFASAAPAPAPAGPAVLVTSRIRRNEASPTSRLKTLSYLDNVLARAEARAAGADEALMVNTHGEVACAAAATVFWLSRAVLHTPPLDCGVLAGTARARLIRAASGLGVPVVETAAGLQTLAGAQAVLITNSLIGLRAVEGLDGRRFPGHDLVRVLAEAMAA